MDLTSLLHLDPVAFLRATGYLGVFLIIFAESGLFFGFFLPGDSLLFTAGLLAANGFFSIVPLCIILATAAIIGDNVGYWFGRRVGPKLFNREDSFFFHPRHVERTRAFYEHHGGKTLILARFVPVVRTYAPILAGVGSMDYRTFLRNNLIGGLLWSIGLTGLGYGLGRIFPWVGQYLTPIILFIIALSLLPVFVGTLHQSRKR